MTSSAPGSSAPPPPPHAVPHGPRLHLLEERHCRETAGEVGTQGGGSWGVGAMDQGDRRGERELRRCHATEHGGDMRAKCEVGSESGEMKEEKKGKRGCWRC